MQIVEITVAFAATLQSVVDTCYKAEAHGASLVELVVHEVWKLV